MCIYIQLYRYNDVPIIIPLYLGTDYTNLCPCGLSAPVYWSRSPWLGRYVKSKGERQPSHQSHHHSNQLSKHQSPMPQS